MLLPPSAHTASLCPLLNASFVRCRREALLAFSCLCLQLRVPRRASYDSTDTVSMALCEGFENLIETESWKALGHYLAPPPLWILSTSL